jgi:hypothetical protein
MLPIYSTLKRGATAGVPDPNDCRPDPDPALHKFCANFFQQNICATKNGPALKLLHIYLDDV